MQSDTPTYATQSPPLATTATVGFTVAQAKLDELVVRAQKGDSTAFTELFNQHRGTVARIAFRMLGPSADLEDVVQDVFLQVYRSLPDFRGQSKFTTWLHRVAVNVVLMIRRRARSRPVLTGEHASRNEASSELSPDQELVRQRRLTAFRQLLDGLSDKKRTVFILHELEGMPPADIAQVVGCPVLTVRTRLFYARRELSQLMRSDPALAQLVDELGSTRADESAGKRSKNSKGGQTSTKDGAQGPSERKDP